MPLYYDLNFALTTSATPGTELTQMWAKTVANQETVSILGYYCASRFAVAGGGQIRIKHNTGATASGGTPQAPAAKNLRYGVAAQSAWSNAGSTITAGGTLVGRITVGFAQTGGQGGYVPITPQDAIQLQPNAANPVDAEWTALAASASVTADLTIEIGEGV